MSKDTSGITGKKFMKTYREAQDDEKVSNEDIREGVAKQQEKEANELDPVINIRKSVNIGDKITGNLVLGSDTKRKVKAHGVVSQKLANQFTVEYHLHSAYVWEVYPERYKFYRLYGSQTQYRVVDSYSGRHTNITITNKSKMDTFKVKDVVITESYHYQYHNGVWRKGKDGKIYLDEVVKNPPKSKRRSTKK